MPAQVAKAGLVFLSRTAKQFSEGTLGLATRKIKTLKVAYKISGLHYYSILRWSLVGYELRSDKMEFTTCKHNVFLQAGEGRRTYSLKEF